MRRGIPIYAYICINGLPTRLSGNALEGAIGSKRSKEGTEILAGEGCWR
jgi:hypothetical protein